MAEVVGEYVVREIRVRAALACSALTDDVAARDRDTLLEIIDGMVVELREARDEAEKATGDRIEELEEERDEAQESCALAERERDEARKERDVLRSELDAVSMTLRQSERELAAATALRPPVKAKRGRKA